MTPQQLIRFCVSVCLTMAVLAAIFVVSTPRAFGTEPSVEATLSLDGLDRQLYLASAVITYESAVYHQAGAVTEHERRAKIAADRSRAEATTTVAASTPSVGGSSVWDRLARCESNGNWSINTGNGYYGGLQFNAQTWRAYGGTGLPHQHPRSTQIAVAERLRADRGFQPWPACSRKLGLR